MHKKVSRRGRGKAVVKKSFDGNINLPSAQGVPLGITRNNEGDAVLYYAGSEPQPDYLGYVNTLIGEKLTEEEICNCKLPHEEFYKGFSWDITKAGFIDISTPRSPKGSFRVYYTEHQPTGSKEWFRKVEAFDGVSVVDVWEKFEKENSNLKGW